MATRKKAKVPLIIFVLAVAGSIFCFSFGQNYNPYFLWAGLGLACLAILFFMTDGTFHQLVIFQIFQR